MNKIISEEKEIELKSQNTNDTKRPENNYLEPKKVFLNKYVLSIFLKH